MAEPPAQTAHEESSPAPIRPYYSRVLLKLGGEMFGGGEVGLDPDVVHLVARPMAEVVRSGVQVAVVIDGGSSVARSFGSAGWSAAVQTTWGCLAP